VRNEQGLPGQGRTRLKKSVQERVERDLRIGTLNIGTLTGKGREIVDMLERRKLDILCLQETRWKGNKSKDLAGGHKLLYSGQTGRNGVAIVLAKEIRETLVQVTRRSERMMSVKLGMGKSILTVISAYAPQSGCEEEEKDKFWRELEEEFNTIPGNEKAIIGGDLNGHVGTDRRGLERWHGGWGYGEKNAEGQRILEFMIAQDMALINTYFKKEENKLVTYSSGGRSSQIDFIACRRRDLKEIQDCAVINGEEVASQHRLVLLKMKIRTERKGRESRVRKIKWWRLNEPEARNQFKEKVMEDWVDAENVQDWWTANSNVIRKAGEEILGRTSGKKAPADKETWWWNEEVQNIVKKKKVLRKEWDRTGNQDDKEKYKEAKKEAKQIVAEAKSRVWDDLYGELETSEGEKKLFKLGKKRNKASKDLTQIKQMKNEQGKVLTDKHEITKRWKQYFEKLLNEENPRSVMEDGTMNQGMTKEVTREEVEKAVSKMKNNKATGPDEIPVEAWKCLGKLGIDKLTELMQKIWNEEEAKRMERQCYNPYL
jgi:exonuclease III